MFLFSVHHITPFLLDFSFSNYGWLHFRYWRDMKLIYPADLWNLLHFLTALENQRKFSAFFFPSVHLIRLSLFCINFYGNTNSDKETQLSTCLKFIGVSQFGFELGVQLLTHTQLFLQPLHLLLQLPDGDIGLIPLHHHSWAHLFLLLQVGYFLPEEVHVQLFALQSFLLSP